MITPMLMKVEPQDPTTDSRTAAIEGRMSVRQVLTWQDAVGHHGDRCEDRQHTEEAEHRCASDVLATPCEREYTLAPSTPRKTKVVISIVSVT